MLRLQPHMIESLRRALLRRKLCLLRISLLAMFIGVCGVQSAYAGLTITPVSWNVIGLDSNDQTAGPDTYQIGARVCNTGGAALSNVVGTFVRSEEHTSELQ